MINWWWQSSRLFVCLLLFGCLLLFLSCPFFLSVPASFSDQLGQVRSLGGSGGGGGGLSLLLYLFVCLPVVQRMYLFTCLFILIAYSSALWSTWTSWIVGRRKRRRTLCDSHPWACGFPYLDWIAPAILYRLRYNVEQFVPTLVQ